MRSKLDILCDNSECTDLPDPFWGQGEVKINDRGISPRNQQFAIDDQEASVTSIFLSFRCSDLGVLYIAHRKAPNFCPPGSIGIV